jgi:hypothetical protein
MNRSHAPAVPSPPPTLPASLAEAVSTGMTVTVLYPAHNSGAPTITQGLDGEPARASRHVLSSPQGAGTAFRGHVRGHGGQRWGHTGQPSRFPVRATMPFTNF